jgi:hemolysin activation/secretion protein
MLKEKELKARGFMISLALLVSIVLLVNKQSIAKNGELLEEALTKGRPEAEKLQEKKDIAKELERLGGDEDIDTIRSGSGFSLGDDRSPVFDISSISIRGNTILTSEELLEDIPIIYNAWSESIKKADPVFLYDLGGIRTVIDNPGQSTKVSARNIQGLVQYILKVYKDKGYVVRVYVPEESLKQGGKFIGEVLDITVIEAIAGKVSINFFDVNGSAAKKEYTRSTLIDEWSPVKEGEPLNQKKLDDYVSLLNENPDRYTQVSLSEGEGEDTLNVDYNVYEVSPWHTFLQIDNAGTRDRRWSPRLGMINTNLTGRDDTLTGVIQGPIDDRMSRNDYSAFASYEVPLYTQRLRLNIFGGRSEFDVDGGQGIDFLGNGNIWGSNLTLNVLQKDNWFFDVFQGVSFEKSNVSTSQFSSQLGSKVYMDLWTTGAKLYKRDDMRKTFIRIDRTTRIGGSHQHDYWNGTTGARTNANSNFWIWNFNASHYQYLEAEKIQRVLASVRYIRPNTRLVSAKMTTFGGMYTVRGYEESAIVADGGVLASFQYEYDLIKRDQAKAAREGTPRDKTPRLRKLAPVAFFDYGRARTEDAVPGEKSREELYSVGGGLLFEYGESFSGGAYYGYPLKAATGTATGDGRVNVYFMLQW